MSDIGDPEVGQWYSRKDPGEMFLITDYDEESGNIEIQTSDGDLDELHEEVWQSLPAEPSQDWTGPIDNMTADDQEGLETNPDQKEVPTDSRELWEDSSAGGDRSVYRTGCIQAFGFMTFGYSRVVSLCVCRPADEEHFRVTRKRREEEEPHAKTNSVHTRRRRRRP